MENAKTNNTVSKNALATTFRAFFRENIKPHLEIYEKRRIFILVTYCILNVISIITLVSAISTLEEVIYKVLIAISLILYMTARSLRKNFQHKIKNKVLNKLFSYIGDFKLYSNQNTDKDYSKIAMIPVYNNIPYVDDLIIGTYKGITVQIEELELTLSSGKLTYTQYKGLLVSFKDIKKNNAVVVTKSKGFKYAVNWGQKVTLEDVVYETIYETSSNDQVEARYILTTGFMQKLLELQKMGINIACCFQHGDLYIGVETSRDMFEPNIWVSLHNIEQYKKILSELKEVLSIIDILKLDQNIGL